jgi:lipopolysaccharide export system protein LptA
MPSPSLTPRRPAALRAFLCALLIAGLCAANALLVQAAKDKTKETETSEDTLTITSDAAAYAIDDEVFTIKGKVTLETSTIKITGRDLVFNNKTMLGTLEGDPVEIAYGKETTATAGRITVDLDSEIVTVSSGIALNHNSKDMIVNMRCDNITVNMDTGDSKAAGHIEIDYTDLKPAPAPKPGGEGKPRVSPAHLTLDTARYNFKTGALSAGSALRLTAPDVALSSGAATGSLADKVFRVSGGVSVTIRDVTATSDSAEVRYGARTATLKGNVRGTRGTDFITGDAVEIDYGKGNRIVRVIGPVNIKIKFKTKKEKPAEEKPEEPAE